MDYDLRICINHLWRPPGLDDYGTLTDSNAKWCPRWHTINHLSTFIDAARAGEVLSGDYLNWLSSVSHTWSALVSQSLLVFLAHVQLFLLWRASSWLLRCGHQSCGKWLTLSSTALLGIHLFLMNYFAGIPEVLSHLSSLPIVCLVHRWVRLVRAIAGQEILY